MVLQRFQKTINSLEEKEEAEKRQLDSVHDQKVQMELNDKKREAMETYMVILSNRKQATVCCFTLLSLSQRPIQSRASEDFFGSDTNLCNHWPSTLEHTSFFDMPPPY